MYSYADLKYGESIFCALPHPLLRNLGTEAEPSRHPCDAARRKARRILPGLSGAEPGKGDLADILQNVQWQKYLFSKVPLLKRLVVHKPVLEKSNKFIDVYSRGKIGINAYPEFIGSIMEEFRYTAKALHNKLRLMENVLEMETSSKDPTALQKAHRQFLLKLQSLKY